MWFQNQSQPLQSETPHLYNTESFTTYNANQYFPQTSSQQASISNNTNSSQNQWSYINPSYASVDSSSYQKSLSHYNDSKESSQNPYTSDPKVNFDSGKGDFERECENFIYNCRTMGSKKESRTTGSRSNSYSGSSPVCSEKRSRSPSTKHHKSYSQERNPKRVRASSSSSRHHRVKKSKKKRVKDGNSSVSPSKSRDYHNQHFSWFSSDSDTDNEKYVKLYKSIEKTALKTIIKEISKIFDRSSGSKEEALKCLRELHKMEFVEYRKNPEFHPLYSLEKKRWDGHMKDKGFDLRHQAVEREWNKYFNVILEKSFVDSWAKKEKKLLKKFLQNSKNKSSVKTHSYSSAIKPDSRHCDSSFSREKGADKRLPGSHSHRKPSSSPSSKEKRYHSRDHYRDSNTKKRDRVLENNSKSSRYSSEAKTVRKNREESKTKDKQPLRVKQSPQQVRKRNSEKLYSSHSSCKDQIPTHAENYNKDLPLKQNPSRKKYEDTKKVDKIVSNYVKKDPHEADTNKEGQSSKTLVPKQNVSVKSRLSFVGSSKPSLKDRLYVPWETKKEKFIGIPMADIPQVNRESSAGITPSTIRVELQTKGDNIGSNERVVIIKNSNENSTLRSSSMSFSSSNEMNSKHRINEPLNKIVKIKGNNNVGKNNNNDSNDDMDSELKMELDNYSPHMNMFSVLKQMKDKFGSLADSISEMYNIMSELNKEGKNLISYIDSDAKTLLLLIKDKINDFATDRKTSLIQKAIYLETLTNLSSFLTEVKEKEKALAADACEKKSSLVKEIDIESLAKAVAGKDCTEIINFIKEYFQFRKLDFKREDIMRVYMDVKQHQSSSVIYKKPDEQSTLNNNSEKPHDKNKDHKAVVKSSPKRNLSKHSTPNMHRSTKTFSTMSRITSTKRLSKAHADKKIVTLKSGKKLVRVNTKIGSNTKSSFVESTNYSSLSQAVKNENSFKMQLKRSDPHAVSRVNVFGDRSPLVKVGATNSSDSEHDGKSHLSSRLPKPFIHSLSQLVNINFGEKLNIYKQFSKYDTHTQAILNKYLKNIMVTHQDMGRVLAKNKK